MLLLLFACIFTDKDVTDLRGELGDRDGDRHFSEAFDGDDCDDEDGAVNPEATEICNGVDDDCDGDADGGATDAAMWYADADGDGYGDPGSITASCARPDGYRETGSDCDDTVATVSPAATEMCNGADDDCDGEVDVNALDATAWHADADGDGFGSADSVLSCDAPDGRIEDATDCDDGSALVHPGALEVCNDLDDDCDTVIDNVTEITEATGISAWYPDDDGDGHGDWRADQTFACDQPDGYAYLGDDCDDADAASYTGATEVCDGADNDCDGTTDVDAIDTATWYADGDRDGYGVATSTTLSCTLPDGYSPDGTDCDDATALAHPGATEVCDAADLDEDCDGVADDGDADVDPASIDETYADADGDGWGDGAAFSLCDPPGGYVAEGTDCDDGDATVHPGAPETCDGVDRACDGAADCELGSLGDVLGGVDAGDRFGWSVATIPDATDIDEVLVGAPGVDGGGTDRGAAYRLPVDNSFRVIFSGAEDGGAAGTAVAAADLVYDGVHRDIYDYPAGDGTPDLIVGAPGDASGDGAVYLFEGPAGISGSTTDATIALSAQSTGAAMGTTLATLTAFLLIGNPGAEESLCSNGTEEDPTQYKCAVTLTYGAFNRGGVPDGACFTGPGPSTGAGSAAVLLEYNGELDETDIAIGAPLDNSESGSVYLHPGSQSTCQDLGDRSFYTDNLAGDFGGDRAGMALAADDIDGDGLDDLVVGAPGQRSGAGGVYVTLAPDLPVGTDHMSDHSLSDLRGPAGSGAGASLVFADFDGEDDGPDLAIGAPTWVNDSGLSTGAVFVVYDLGDWTGDLDLEDIALRYTCATDGCLAGTSLAAGDFDGVGADDLAVGAPGWDDGGGATGAVAFILSSYL